MEQFLGTLIGYYILQVFFVIYALSLGCFNKKKEFWIQMIPFTWVWYGLKFPWDKYKNLD